MIINAVAVTTSNMPRTVQFYQLLGFQFPDFDDKTPHLEPLPIDNSARLMIDTADLIKQITGEVPKPGNHSSFAIECASPDEVNLLADQVQNAGFTVAKQPWDAFWGQRYAIVEDPDGYKIDLYASL